MKQKDLNKKSGSRRIKIAVIPVAGEGTRLRPLTHTTPKVLINVAGKPILGHILDKLKTLGIEEVVLIVGYLGNQIVEYVEKNYKFNVKVVQQEERLGLGHAVCLSKEHVGSQPVLIILGDTIIEADFTEVLRGDTSYIGLKEVEDPSRFGTVALKEGFITRLVEKAENPPSNLAMVGVYAVKDSAELFQALEELIENNIRTKGEYQLTDALQKMVERGVEMRSFMIDGWFDCGQAETVLETNRTLLEKNSKPVSIPGCIIIPPVYVARSAGIHNSIIGPHVTVAENSIVEGSVVKNSIINESAVVKNMLLKESLVGNHAVVTGRLLRLNVGDSSEINFG